VRWELNLTRLGSGCTTRQGLLFVAIATAGFACSPTDVRPPTAASSPVAVSTKDQWEILRSKPMRLPQLKANEHCPVSPVVRPAPSLGLGVGKEPVFAVLGQLVVSSSVNGNQVLWAASPTYAGPLRIRGAQLDGSGAMLFARVPSSHWSQPPVRSLEGDSYYSELDLLEAGTETAAPWRTWPSLTLVDQPGCYGWQVDGTDFAEIIIVLVR